MEIPMNMRNQNSNDDMKEIKQFIKHRASEIDPAWASNVDGQKNAKGNPRTYYESTSTTIVVRHVSSNVVACTIRFKNFLQHCKERSRNHAISEFNIQGEHTWQEVQHEAERAVKEYEKKGKSWKHPFRTAGRALGGSTNAMQAWLDILPTGEYSFVVCGALKLVFGAAARMDRIRKKVLETLSALPGTLEAHHSYLELYRQDEGLLGKAEELYIAILTGVEGMIEWLDHSTYKEVLKAFFQQERYAEPLEQQITTNIQDKSRQFCERANLCLHQRLGEIGSGIEQNTLLVEENNFRLQDLDLMFQEQTQDHSKAFNSLADLLKDLTISYVRARTDQAECLQRLEFNQCILQSQMTLQPLRRTPLVGPQELRDGLNVDHKVLIRDIHVSAACGQRLRPTRQQRAAWLMQNLKFQRWFSTNESQMLIVDGMELSTNSLATSPLTFLVALLMKALEGLPGAVPITFFCGFHATPGDGLEGAQGMMRSIIFQLLLQNWDFDCAFIEEGFLKQVLDYEISQLCGLFRNLLTSAPDNTTIFCIIDGVSWFENPGRRNDICTVMENLQELVEELRQESQGGSLVNLKILVTSPKASGSANEWGDQDSRLIMPMETGGNGQTFNIMHTIAHTDGLLNHPQDGVSSWAVADPNDYSTSIS